MNICSFKVLCFFKLNEMVIYGHAHLAKEGTGGLLYGGGCPEDLQPKKLLMMTGKDLRVEIERCWLVREGSFGCIPPGFSY